MTGGLLNPRLAFDVIYKPNALYEPKRSALNPKSTDSAAMPYGKVILSRSPALTSVHTDHYCMFTTS